MTLRVLDANRDRFRESVAATIKATRLAAGLSLRTLAEMADISNAMMVAIESGSTPCSLWAAAQIAEALDTTIDALAPVLLDEKGAAE